MRKLLTMIVAVMGAITFYGATSSFGPDPHLRSSAYVIPGIGVNLGLAPIATVVDTISMTVARLMRLGASRDMINLAVSQPGPIGQVRNKPPAQQAQNWPPQPGAGQAGAGQAGAGQPGIGQAGANQTAPVRQAPPPPVVTTVTGSVDGIGRAAQGPGATAAQPAAPAAAQPVGAGLVKGADLGKLPPDLLRFLNPTILTNQPANAQTLDPASRQMLQQIIAQARANPAAFREQLAAVTKALGGR